LSAGFRAFRQDLSDYLASSDYLTAFLRDSLQRARGLLDEAHGCATGADVNQLSNRIASLDEQLEFVAHERLRIAETLRLDWSEAFARAEREIASDLERFARDGGAKLLRTLGASIDTWFLSSHSLEWLMLGQWTPLVRDYRDDVLAAGRRVFDQQQMQSDAGLDLPGGTADLLRRAGIDLRNLRARALTSLGAVLWQGQATVPVDLDAMPVKKGVMDRVAFRSFDTVRQRLFGSKQKPDSKIPGKDKAARLGEPGRLFLHQCVTQFRAELAPKTVAASKQFFGQALRAAIVSELHKQLAAYEPRLQQKHEELSAERARLVAVTLPLQLLGTQAQKLQQALGELGRQFDHEIATAVPRDVVLQPQPRRAREREERQAEKNRETRRT
jgi:hypothetical protein